MIEKYQFCIWNIAPTATCPTGEERCPFHHAQGSLPLQNHFEKRLTWFSRLATETEKSQLWAEYEKENVSSTKKGKTPPNPHAEKEGVPNYLLNNCIFSFFFTQILRRFSRAQVQARPREKGTKSCDSGATKSASGLTGHHTASAEPEEKITKRGQKSSKEGQKTIYITALHFRGRQTPLSKKVMTNRTTETPTSQPRTNQAKTPPTSRSPTQAPTDTKSEPK